MIRYSHANIEDKSISKHSDANMQIELDIIKKSFDDLAPKSDQPQSA